MRSMHPEVAQAVLKILSMRSVCRCELAIDKCNELLLQTLLEKAEAGDPAQLTDIIERYVFDVLFTICTDETPEFLANTADITNMTTAMEKWRTYAFPDSVLRFFPRLTQFLNRFNLRSDFEHALRSHLSSSGYEPGGAIAELVEEDSTSHEIAVEACTAVVMAGADPLITHIQSTLVNVYSKCNDGFECGEDNDTTSDSEGERLDLEENKKRLADRHVNETTLVTHIREEFENMSARLSDPPTISELVHGRIRMPLLHATMRESLRLQHPYTNSVRLVAPKGGIAVVDVLIPGDVSPLPSLHLLLLHSPSLHSPSLHSPSLRTSVSAVRVNI
jgi:hypothetical protein